MGYLPRGDGSGDARAIVSGEAIERHGLNDYDDEWEKFISDTAPPSVTHEGFCRNCQEKFTMQWKYPVYESTCPLCKQPMRVYPLDVPNLTIAKGLDI